MTLTGMSDQTFSRLMDEVCEIQFLIVQAGGIATKTAVENIMMRRHQLDRGDAHSLTNYAESRQDFMVNNGRVEWLAARPKPTITNYPEFKELL